MPVTLSVGQLLDDRYRVVQLLSDHPGAAVYVVRHLRLDRLFALKVLAGSGGIRDQRERRAMARLRHRNVVSVVDALTIGSAVGLVMEYVPGVTLRWVIADAHRATAPDELSVSLAERDALAIQIMRGVAAIHHAGFIHRDIKPSNILVSVEDSSLRAQITDFGLARELYTAAQFTPQGASLGTVRYAAPEQVRDSCQADIRSDIFALGGVLYALLVGRPAFPSEADFYRFAYQGEPPVPPIHSPFYAIPAQAKDAIRQALRHDPAERPASVRDLMAAWGAPAPRRTPLPVLLIEHPDDAELIGSPPAAWVAEHLHTCLDCLDRRDDLLG